MLLPTFQEAKLANTRTLCKGAFAHESFLWQHQTPLTKVVCVTTVVRNLETMFLELSGQNNEKNKRSEIIFIFLQFSETEKISEKIPRRKILKKNDIWCKGCDTPNHYDFDYDYD